MYMVNVEEALGQVPRAVVLDQHVNIVTTIIHNVFQYQERQHRQVVRPRHRHYPLSMMVEQTALQLAIGIVVKQVVAGLVKHLSPIQ